MAYNEWRAGSDRYQMTLDLNLVQTKRFKATFELESGDGEMYDLQEDPNEMVNLFHDPGYRNAKKELEDMMHARPGEKLEEPLPRVGIN